ncbi:hypothetical protein BC829DRAFT_133892 [Chytridium lagenaria]|nr:hypothetical protein BC829DRAFT_133892 [Chytridium lagenaria]
MMLGWASSSTTPYFSDTNTMRKDSVHILNSLVNLTPSSSSSALNAGRMSTAPVNDGAVVRIKVATSKRSMVVVVKGDATVSDFLDVVSSKIIRGFPIGSVVLNPQPVVAAMSRDGFFFDEDDLVRYAFDTDTEVYAFTNDELRKVLRTQLDPSSHVSPFLQVPDQPQTAPTPPPQRSSLLLSSSSSALPSPSVDQEDDHPNPHKLRDHLRVGPSRRGSLIGAVTMNHDAVDPGLVSLGGAPILPAVGSKPLVFVSFTRLNSARMVGVDKAVGTCDPHWIYKGLKEAGFSVFIDESEREAGEPLSEELVDMMLKGNSA